MDFCDYNFNSIGGASTEQYFQSDLISPTIDLTGIEYPVLNFTHYLLTLRENQTIAYLSYSIDNGITWSDTIDINTQNFLGTMGGYNFETEIYLKPFIGYNSMNVSQFKFKFIANGNFYFWTIDDVYITNQPMAEFEASTQWFAGAPNFKTPSSQVDRVHFMVDAHNIGNTDFDAAFKPAIEFNIFPYEEAQTRQFTIYYSVGPEFKNYTDTTVFNKLNETVFRHQLNFNFEQVKEWGGIDIRLGISQYLHNTSLYSIYLNPNLNWQVAKGLRFNFGGYLSYVKDRINIAKSTLSDQEILLQLKQLDTSFTYSTYVGLNYRFGSKYNNFVNPRF